jgi:ATPase subunit of ABC transporter with duplicated ATPase domains
MLTITELAMAFGPKLLFTDVNLNLNSGNRYGLVGANGAGKTTFMKVLAGEEEPCLGEVSLVKRARIGMLKQDQFRFENTLIINTVIAGKKELWDALCEKEELLAREVCDEATGYRLGEIEEIIMNNDGYTAEYVAAELLVGLGVKEEYHHQPLKMLSGGYKLRVLLAQSLFDNPDVLMLDEPTNHLDIPSIYWLESYLKEQFKGALIFISHDIAFVNNIANYILDIDYGEIRQYTGNYNDFIRQKREVIEQKMHQLSSAEKHIAKMKAFIDRFRAKASKARQAQSREKMLDKMILPDIEKSSRVSPMIRFGQKRPSGKTVVKIDSISKSFGENNILNKVSFNVGRGEKIIIIGPNGVGKSTFLKVILGKLAADSGGYEWGHETYISYFSQDHHDLLNEDITVLKWLSNNMEDRTENALRSALGQLLFRQDDAYKNILKLSGGEGARLLLAKIVLELGNVLILDEPTNHLDIEAKESLRDALKDYPGTLIMVTHDRDFASSIATRVLAITEKKITDFHGTYDEYLLKHGKDYFKG